MHFWYNMGHLEKFLTGPYKPSSPGQPIYREQGDLPGETEVYVLKVMREGDL